MRVHERQTASPDETESLGAALGRAAEGRELLGLIGDLGTGKTCLVRGLARGLGIDPERVHSPSFTLVNEYGGGRLALVHVDVYRLERPRDDEPFFRDVLYGEGVAAVEWYDRFLPDPADEVLLLMLEWVGGDRRLIRLEARGERHERFLARALDACRPPR